jgi:hypothetical protein
MPFFNGWRPGGTGSLCHSAHDFAFFHRIQRAKASTVGQVGCVHELRNECRCSTGCRARRDWKCASQPSPCLPIRANASASTRRTAHPSSTSLKSQRRPADPDGLARSRPLANGYFRESFVDELVHSCGQDPYLFRRGLLSKGRALWPSWMKQHAAHVGAMLQRESPKALRSSNATTPSPRRSWISP